jgi:hypothetical protein
MDEARMDARSTVVQYPQRRGGGRGGTDSGERRTGLLFPVAGGEFGGIKNRDEEELSIRNVFCQIFETSSY